MIAGRESGPLKPASCEADLWFDAAFPEIARFLDFQRAYGLVHNRPFVFFIGIGLHTQACRRSPFGIGLEVNRLVCVERKRPGELNKGGQLCRRWQEKERLGWAALALGKSRIGKSSLRHLAAVPDFVDEDELAAASLGRHAGRA